MAATFPSQVDTASGLTVTTLASASITPVNGTLYLVAVANVHASVGTPTLSGTNGFSVTWTQVTTRADAGSVERLTVFRGVASSGTAGVITADFGGVSQTIALMVTMKCNTVDQASSQGVVQSVSATQAASAAPTVTFSAFATVYNIALMFSMTSLSTTWTNSTSGWSPFPVVNNTGGSLGSMFRSHATLDTVPVGTFGASGITCSIGVELKTNNTLAGPGNGTKVVPLSDSGYRTGFGGNLRGIQIISQDDFMFGVCGPSGYTVGDPANLSAFLTMPENTSMSMLRGLWRNKNQRDDTKGNPSAPSQRHSQYGYLKKLFVPVDAGARTVSLDCLMDQDPGASFRPQLIVRANSDIGISSDVVVTAASGTSWQTLTASFTAKNQGVVEVWRFHRDRDITNVWWDNVSTT